MRTLYRGGQVACPSAPSATALAVAGGVIEWLGRDDDIGAVPAGTDVVDLGGAWVAPAFVDAHVHTTATGLALTGLDLSTARSLAEALAAVEEVTRRTRGRPVLGSGWDETRWPERRPPTAAELDRAGYGGSVYLARVDGHSAVASSALAATVPGLAGLTGYGSDGWHTRNAHDALRGAAFGALTPGHVQDAQRAALREAARHGIGCVHEMAGPSISSEQDLRLLLDLAAGEPVAEVIGYWGELHAVEAARALGAAGAAGDLFCDGSLGSHTAALREPYADQPGTAGRLRFGTDELVEHIVACDVAGLQAGFHAIGDAAVDQVLDAFELASARVGRPVGRGHRIEHAEYVHEPERLARCGLTASMQPMFDAAWGGEQGMYAQRLGSHRARALNRLADLHAAGAPLAFSSDAPVTGLGPWAAIRAAMAPHDPTAGVPGPVAFAAHTAGGWQAARRSGGVLQVGALATFAVWDVPEFGRDGLPDLGAGDPRCLRTVASGREIWRRPG